MGKATLRVIFDSSELADIRKTWNALLEKSASDTIFLTWEWMNTWWECFGEGKSLFIVLAEDEGALVGIAPFHVTKANLFSVRPLSHLEFLGTSGVITEYPDFIILQGREKELVSAFMDFVLTHSSAWDAMNLASMRQDAINLMRVREYCKEKGMQYLEYATHVSPFIELPGSVEEYMKTLSHGTRAKFKRYRRKLQEGRVVEMHETHDRSKAADDFETIIGLHQKRWEQKGGPGSFTQSRTRFLNFHESIARKFFDNGWLYLLRLMVDHSPVAGHYSFLYHNKVYCHTTGFDPDWTEFNVGSVLQLLSIEDSIKKGAREFDFLRGPERYKYSWAKKERICVDTAIWRNPSVARRIAAERKMRKAVKHLFPRSLVEKVYSRMTSRD